jgi:phenylacetate-CoA ligase
MPLLRYDIGDYAEVGPPCPCGRGLPVLTRILGRERAMLTTADGRRYWPFFGAWFFRDVAPVRQFQFVQTALDALDARMVLERPITDEEEAALRALILGFLPAPFAIRFVWVDAIPRAASGKYEEFRSELPARPA